jgi:Cu+-exporting ATPase
VKDAVQRNIKINRVEDFKTLPGKGVEAKVGNNLYAVGPKRLISEFDSDLSIHSTLMNKQENQGESVSYLINKTEKRVIGFVSFKDTIRPEAKIAIGRLKSLGIQTIMLTGDNKGSAQAVGKELGIDSIRAEVLPEDKSDIIKELKKNGNIVGMVGDGINDAPALASANVGMAMSTGTDVAMHTAGITLMRGNPLLISDAISISRKTYSKIRQNLFWAFIYNVIGIPLAAFGFLSPEVAGSAMAMSSVSVVANSLLLKRWKSAK